MMQYETIGWIVVKTFQLFMILFFLCILGLKTMTGRWIFNRVKKESVEWILGKLSLLPEHVKRGVVDVKYYYSGSVKKMRMVRSRANIESVAMSSSAQDITDNFKTFLGPYNCFGGCSYTPKQLGLEDIVIRYNDGSEVTFGQDEVIQLNLKNIRVSNDGAPEF